MVSFLGNNRTGKILQRNNGIYLIKREHSMNLSQRNLWNLWFKLVIKK